MKSVLPPLLLALLVGCRNPTPGYTPVPPAPIPQVSVKEVRSPLALMPLDLGNQWTYSLRAQSFQAEESLGEVEQTVDYRVTRVAPDGATTLVLEQGGKPLDEQVWKSTGGGLYQLSSGTRGVPFEPAQPLALLPLTDGRKFTWEGRGQIGENLVGRSRMASEIFAPQNVDTAIGTLSAVPIVTRTDYDGGHIENTSWFRPGIGLIRLRQETFGARERRDVLLLTLTNYAIKQ